MGMYKDNAMFNRTNKYQRSLARFPLSPQTKKLNQWTEFQGNWGRIQVVNFKQDVDNSSIDSDVRIRDKESIRCMSSLNNDLKVKGEYDSFSSNSSQDLL